jgi:hypothetical protein
MRKYGLLFTGAVVLVLASASIANAGWQVMLGSPDKNEEANYVIPLDKGGYIIAGSVSPGTHGDRDMFIACVTKAGQILWQKEYGGELTDYGLMVQPTFDGGYVLVGEKGAYDQDAAKILLVKTDSKGDSIWTKSFAQVNNSFYYTANAIRQTPDSGFIMLGTNDDQTYGYYDVFLLKVDKNGEYQWDQHFGGEENDFGNSIEVTSDGGYIIAGSTNSDTKGMFDMYIIKTGTDGDTVWTRKMGRVYGDIALSTQPTRDAGYIVCGEVDMMSQTEKASNAILIKLDKDGNTAWYKEYGGERNDGFQSLVQTADNGFAVVGYTNSFGKNERKDVYLVRTDSLGNELWYKTYGDYNTDYGTCITQTKDNGFIISGTYTAPFSKKTDIYLIRTDTQGKIENK